MKPLFCCVLFILTLNAIAGDHNPILPQPRKVICGKAQLAPKGLTIEFDSKPSSEDRFAAHGLSGVLSKIMTTPALVKETKLTGPSIIFERTGDNSPLPLPCEKPGPTSRESCKIIITPGNVRIAASSSAGLFYAVQTLRQMIEGYGDKAFLPEVEIEDSPIAA